jgi:hypothetical protein
VRHYNIELLQAAAERLQEFLYDLKVKFEISAAGAYYHFEILTDAAGAAMINKFLDTHIITEV